MQVRFGALDLRAHDCFATCKRAGHHVSVRKVLESALQATQGGVCLWEIRSVPTAEGKYAWRRRCHKRANIRIAVCRHQIRLAIFRNLVSAHVHSPVERGSFEGLIFFLILSRNLKELNALLRFLF